MTDERPVTLPTADQIARARANAQALVEELASTPESERQTLDSDKFQGPVGTRVLQEPPAPEASGT